MSDPAVLCEVHPSIRSPQHKIARLCLNAPQSLNALTGEMFQLISESLEAWAQDESIRVVFLEGSGTKAFCAGGDVRRLQQSILSDRKAGRSPLASSQAFFALEYATDYRIHRYPKPIVAWGQGIVMGGGLGLLVGASHRLVGEDTLMAMPETAIGLYPDVGASYFLSRLPGKMGLFLGLSGARIGAADALYGGLADAFVSKTKRDTLWQAMLDLDFARSEDIHADLDAIIAPLLSDPGASILDEYQRDIDRLLEGDDLPAIVQRILNFKADGAQAFFQNAQNLLRKASPTSLAVCFEQLRRSEGMSLEACFQMELILSVQFCLRHDFVEGVRALLVDKDRNPRWQPDSLAAVDPAWVHGHFQSPWDVHPLPLGFKPQEPTN